MLALESFDIFRVVSGDKFMKNKTIGFKKEDYLSIQRYLPLQIHIHQQVVAE
jgi:hypothetical protein